MPTQLVKENPTLARLVFEGKWTWEEFYEVNTAMYKLLDQSDQQMDVIIDLRGAKELPSGALTHFRNIKYSEHPRLGHTVVLGANKLMSLMGGMLTKVKPSLAQTVEFAQTLEQAYQLLGQTYQTPENR